MTTLSLKKKITEALNSIDDDEFLKGIYTIMNNKIKDNEFEYSDELIAELDRRSELIETGKAKFYTVEEVRKKILANLSK
jgi:hypothetical protein